MDARLNKHFDQNQDGKAIVWRTAGANFANVRLEIEHMLRTRDITDLTIFTHTDCGAAKVIAAVVGGSTSVEDPVYRGLVKPFLNNQFSEKPTVREVISVMTDMQKILIGKSVTGKRLWHKNCDIVDTSSTSVAHNGRSLVVGLPTSRRFGWIAWQTGLNPAQTYFLNALEPERLVSDLMVAANPVGVQKIIIFKDTERQYARDYIENPKIRDFEPAIRQLALIADKNISLLRVTRDTC